MPRAVHAASPAAPPPRTAALLALPLQLLALGAFWGAGALAARALRLPLPGGVVGMLLLLAALRLGVVRAEWLERGAAWLFRHMLLFFIPAAVGAIQYPELLGSEGARALAVVAVSTVLVMAVTGATVEWLARRREEAP
ncbi:LrgA family protein [Anaeromyxobacter sp. K]|uniref:CidA/LrgA family protein n=1 Tax=Anaeromyxobacter sp. (strain K) TaxID=447217 RepID=UPI00015F9B3C|nr:CidA/LrgA family protein [Anaeromyxobacter sp. K]ACG71333.1 LrgA family protein [Anaeromyxobacter sp. K]